MGLQGLGCRVVEQILGQHGMGRARGASGAGSRQRVSGRTLARITAGNTGWGRWWQVEDFFLSLSISGLDHVTWFLRGSDRARSGI